jgi:orotate phosphoribosyltransferase
MKPALIALLREHSYKYDPQGRFQLVSGKLSQYYVNCKATTMRGDAADLIGGLVAEHLPDSVRAVGGLTMGADPIALATAAWCARHGRAVNAFSVRKEPKKHGTRQWVEGCAEPGMAVAVVDDVATTGGSTIAAVERCREEGLVVVAAVVLVDRQEDDGLESIRRAAGPDTPVSAIVTLAELRG